MVFCTALYGFVGFCRLPIYEIAADEAWGGGTAKDSGHMENTSPWVMYRSMDGKMARGGRSSSFCKGLCCGTQARRAVNLNRAVETSSSHKE